MRRLFASKAGHQGVCKSMGYLQRRFRGEAGTLAAARALDNLTVPAGVVEGAQ